MGERICESEFFSARHETQAISANLAKFHNAALENSGHKAAVHNLIRGSLGTSMLMKALNSSFINKAIPMVALLFAIPATLFLGVPLLVIFEEGMNYGGKNSTQGMLLLLLAFLGICGLWLRAVAQPFFNESIFLKRAIGVLLLAGVVPVAISIFPYIIYFQQFSNDSSEDAVFFYALLACGVTGLAMALHNFLPNPAFKRDCAKARSPLFLRYAFKRTRSHIA